MAKKDNFGKENYGLKCHFGISNQQGGDRRLPFAYTERVFEKLEENTISPKQGICHKRTCFNRLVYHKNVLYL
ncbi:MAG: hypothetical protein IJS30_00705 [Bacteroidales bacterium]|nr:hypothetical protein [Bacteroidales bacterium]